MLLSVIIPVHNGGQKFEQCLTALFQTLYPDWECIVVDDGSTDNSVEIAQSFDVRLLKTPQHQLGPAAGRNIGAAAANGDLLFFVDADVLVQPGTIGHAVASMKSEPGLAACFGSYDDQPTAVNFLSQYRNLLHHFVHQTSNSDASTFWSGCGVIRREVFDQMGGFQTITPGRPSIEDIELGYRMRQAGHQIKLEKLLLVTHMKKWTLGKVVITDIRDRAWPWTRLIVQEGGVPNDLNLQFSQRVSTAVSFLLVLLLGAAFWQPGALLAALLLAILFIQLNRPFYRFLRQKRGIWFTSRAIILHWIYFLYSGATFGLGLFVFGILRREFFIKSAPVSSPSPPSF